MTPDEIKKKLEAAGIPVGDWSKTHDGPVRSPLLERQKASLMQIQALLETQLQKDQEALSHLHVALQKAKHGGGHT